MVEGGPNPWEETLFHSHLQVHRGGVRVRCGKGIQNWGIEGIRTGTSDRFGRGRGECWISARGCSKGYSPKPIPEVQSFPVFVPDSRLPAPRNMKDVFGIDLPIYASLDA